MIAESAQWRTYCKDSLPSPTVAILEPEGQRQEIDRIEKLETGLRLADVAAIYAAYDQLKARQGNLSAVSIGELSKESGVPVPRLQQFLLSEARQDRVDLHATSLLWHSLNPDDRAGATHVPGRSEPAITVTIRQKLVTAALPAGLDVIKAYDEIVDRPGPKRENSLSRLIRPWLPRATGLSRRSVVKSSIRSLRKNKPCNKSGLRADKGHEIVHTKNANNQV
jgi:hypothetical protein